jgi:hypothetical protein
VFGARNIIGTKANVKDVKKGGRGGGRQVGDNASYYSGAKTAVTAAPEENLSDYEKEQDFMQYG